MTNSPAAPRLARFGWLTLGVTLAVIVWGAVVRATGSGAGCGNHWPLCNGEVIPPSPTVATLIELSHRITSGLSLLMVLGMLVWSRKVFAARHPARVASWVAMGVMLLEAAIGAGLVKFELVADDASMARALTLGAHLVNTQLLLASIFLAAWWSGGAEPIRIRGSGIRGWAIGAALLSLVIVGMTGAIASLGDTLFPARTLTEGIAMDRDPSAPLLIRLRVWHPTLAVVAGLLLLAVGALAPRWRDTPAVARAARAVTALVLVQWTIGLVTLLLLVPMAMQLLHLLSADLLWTAVVWLGAVLLADQPRTTAMIDRAASRS
jgi:cytochrome c oxidase assembly protein subunit 15